MSKPEYQCLWPSHRRHQPLVGQHPQEQRGEVRGDSHRGQHVQVLRGHGEHVEAAHQEAKACFPGSCRTGLFHSSSHGTAEENCTVRHGSTCTETNYIPVTVAQGGWCSTSSLLLAPTVARLITIRQALALNKDKTRHSPSSDREGSSNTTQPDLQCWDLRHPVSACLLKHPSVAENNNTTAV